jgi:hypothetical protein
MIVEFPVNSHQKCLFPRPFLTTKQMADQETKQSSMSSSTLPDSRHFEFTISGSKTVLQRINPGRRRSRAYPQRELLLLA